mmetsp:Transcript_19765/g.39382  ORF Transcript_19765/g.39382 Transcript_19765/m.39382 type:complete len:916 (-) Transcript_19765:49-2796(-)
MPDKASSSKTALPKREADLFRDVVKYYESKQFKRGLKAADMILKKFPDNGETLAMKGLTLNGMANSRVSNISSGGRSTVQSLEEIRAQMKDKKKEAQELVKAGVMNDMRSHVCWHVYGLLHRSNRSYNEAIKAYKQALRIDPGNLQILRDLSLLQIQMRDRDGFVDTRFTILNQHPNNRIHWLSFALAKHFAGDHDGAINVIDAYYGTLDEGSSEKQRNYESSELVLYKCKIMLEMDGQEEKVLKYLDDCRDIVVDEGALLSTEAMAYLRLGKFDKAKEIYIKIFETGAHDDHKIHSGYMCTILELDRTTCIQASNVRGTQTIATLIHLDTQQKAKLLEAYRSELQPLMPKSNSLLSIPLNILEGDELIEAIDFYMRKFLVKGVPSLGDDIKSLLYVENDKSGKGMKCLKRAKDPLEFRSIELLNKICGLVDGYLVALHCGKSRFPNSDDLQPTETLLWTLHLRSQLHEIRGEYQEGLVLVDRCIKQQPDGIEFSERKARLLKLCGDVENAAEVLDSARELDLQDRYINNKTAKYMLRANKPDVALQRMALFTRHEGNPAQNIYDMQVSWYEIELARCMIRKNDWGKALKQFAAVIKHYEDFNEDQFDFHAYCIRKVTLRAYIDILRFEDGLYGTRVYCDAVEGMIVCYLHLHDNPGDASSGANEPDYSSMTASQRKKAKAIARKKKKNNVESKVSNGEKSANGDGGKICEVDEDPNGELLLKKNHLDEAKKYSDLLIANASSRISSWLIQYDVSVRRGKQLLALQALYKAKQIDPTDSDLFFCIVDFALREGPEKKDCNAIVLDIVTKEMSVLLCGKSVNDYVSQAAEKIRKDSSTSLYERICVAKALVRVSATSVKEAASLIVDGGINGKYANILNCQKALDCLKTFGVSADKLKISWVKQVKERYQLVKNFE